ncbi:MAG: SulP family inorganic anion transporter [Acidimicrobiales bacterium]
MSARIPIFDWLASYERGWLRADLVAGATVWAVLIPSALAYAVTSGSNPSSGLTPSRWPSSAMRCSVEAR